MSPEGRWSSAGTSDLVKLVAIVPDELGVAGDGGRVCRRNAGRGVGHGVVLAYAAWSADQHLTRFGHVCRAAVVAVVDRVHQCSAEVVDLDGALSRAWYPYLVTNDRASVEYPTWGNNAGAIQAGVEEAECIRFVESNVPSRREPMQDADELVSAVIVCRDRLSGEGERAISAGIVGVDDGDRVNVGHRFELAEGGHLDGVLALGERRRVDREKTREVDRRRGVELPASYRRVGRGDRNGAARADGVAVGDAGNRKGRVGDDLVDRHRHLQCGHLVAGAIERRCYQRCGAECTTIELVHRSDRSSRWIRGKCAQTTGVGPSDRAKALSARWCRWDEADDVVASTGSSRSGAVDVQRHLAVLWHLQAVARCADVAWVDAYRDAEGLLCTSLRIWRRHVRWVCGLYVEIESPAGDLWRNVTTHLVTGQPDVGHGWIAGERIEHRGRVWDIVPGPVPMELPLESSVYRKNARPDVH